MRRILSKRAEEDFQQSPIKVQRAFDKQAKLLTQNLRHPSLHAKKYDEANDRWQARVNSDWRFYFRISGDCYIILSIKRHPK